MKTDSIIDIHKEKDLVKGLKGLVETDMPTRDLWPDIANRLTARETKAYTPRWIPWAIAATLMVSFSSVLFSWNHLQIAQKVIADGNINHNVSFKADIQAQLRLMEREYGLAKSALLAQIGMHSAQAHSDLILDVQSNLMIIEQATSELKAAIIKQPDNPSLTKLLKSTYQQELVVLTQLAKLDFGA